MIITDLHPTSLQRDSQKEGPMFDRDRFLAADHAARLHAEAEARRLSAIARSIRHDTSADRPAGLRAAIGRWLVATGSQLAAEPDPCGPAAARTA